MKRKKKVNENVKKKILFAEYLLASLLILAVAMFFSGVVEIILAFFYKTGRSVDITAGMVEGVIGAIATGLVLFQLKSGEETEKHQNKIEEATFVLQYNKSFIQDKNMTEVERLLEEQVYYDDEPKKIITDQNRQQFVNYLVYLEGIAPLILNGVLDLDYVDDLLAYRFFLAVDNVEVQKDQLVPYAEYYRGCYKLHKMWKKYKEDNFLSFPKDDCKNKGTMKSLSCVDTYEEFSTEIKANRRKKFDRYSCKQFADNTDISDKQYADIAKLIYETDPYIYPAMFGEGRKGKKNAVKILPTVIETGKDRMFTKSNLYVLLDKKRIIGLILWNGKNLSWSSKTLLETAKKAGIRLNEDNISLVQKEYLDARYLSEGEDKEDISLINICVRKSCRGRGAGTFMLRNFLYDHNGETAELAVLADNNRAVNLYYRLGFIENGKETEGFSLSPEKPKCKLMIKHPASYYKRMK